MVESLAIMTVC